MKFTNEHKNKIRQSHLVRNANKMSQICEMAKQGKTTKEIATFFNQTPQSINKVLQRRGMKTIRGTSLKKGISTNPQKIQNICEMAKQGKTTKEIANYYNSMGCKHSFSHINKILKKQNIFLERLPNGNANPQKVKEICEMFKSGIRVTDIAKHFNYSGTAGVARLLTKNGLRTYKLRQKRTDGYTKDSQGYLWTRIKDDNPMISMKLKSGLVSVHRLVMANKLGRPLTSTETVHHIDGNKQNNHPDNLQLRQGKHGKGTRMKCADCGSDNISSLEWLQCNSCNSTKVSFSHI